MRHSIIAVVALAVLSTAGLARAAAPATYVDNVNGFRLDPPAGWQVKPYTDGGELKLELISADTITDDKGNSFYLIQVRTDKNHLGTDAKPLLIIPGMVATVDIITGEKSVLDYILKPVLKARWEALRER